jgi:hypothetical protein
MWHMVVKELSLMGVGGQGKLQKVVEQKQDQPLLPTLCVVSRWRRDTCLQS